MIKKVLETSLSKGSTLSFCLFKSISSTSSALGLVMLNYYVRLHVCNLVKGCGHAVCGHTVVHSCVRQQQSSPTNYRDILTNYSRCTALKRNGCRQGNLFVEISQNSFFCIWCELFLWPAGKDLSMFSTTWFKHCICDSVCNCVTWYLGFKSPGNLFWEFTGIRC